LRQGRRSRCGSAISAARAIKSRSVCSDGLQASPFGDQPISALAQLYDPIAL
jgi:hypothetical protein